MTKAQSVSAVVTNVRQNFELYASTLCTNALDNVIASDIGSVNKDRIFDNTAHILLFSLAHAASAACWKFLLL